MREKEMNNHLKKLSIKATIENLKDELKSANALKKVSIKRLIAEWEKALELLQVVVFPVTLVPVYVNS